MLRLSSAEYRKVLGISNNKAPETITKRPKRDIKSVVTQSISNLRTAQIRTQWKPEQQFQVEWHGATILTLNELLRLDYRSLTGYRKAWKEACQDAIYSTGKICKLKKPIVLKLYRRSGKLIDNDGMSAAFKFAIDGMRLANLIPEDNPLVITDIELEQEVGSPLLKMSFEVVNA